MRIIGLDPGLRNTGWGVIDVDGSRLSYVAHGSVSTLSSAPLPSRLYTLYEELQEVLQRFSPDEAVVEETFVNKNAVSTLKLGQARGIALLVPASAGIPVAEYLPNLIKKAVVGSGHAQKQQVAMMVRTLLPSAGSLDADAADALAAAICHAHLRQSDARVADALRQAGAA